MNGRRGNRPRACTGCRARRADRPGRPRARARARARACAPRRAAVRSHASRASAGRRLARLGQLAVVQDRDAEALEPSQVEDALVLVHRLADERRSDCEPHAAPDSASVSAASSPVQPPPQSATSTGPLRPGRGDRIPGVDHRRPEEGARADGARPPRRDDHAIGGGRELGVARAAGVQAHVDAGRRQAPGPVGAVAGSGLAVRGRAAGERELPAQRTRRLEQRDLGPGSPAATAAAMPAGPPPITSTRGPPCGAARASAPRDPCADSEGMRSACRGGSGRCSPGCNPCRGCARPRGLP